MVCGGFVKVVVVSGGGELFKAFKIEEATGSMLAPRFTAELTTYCKDIIGKGVTINTSAEAADPVLGSTMVTKLLSTNYSTISLKALPAPTMRCTMEGCCSKKVVVATDRGPPGFGKLGFLSRFNVNLPSSVRLRVRDLCFSDRPVETG